MDGEIGRVTTVPTSEETVTTFILGEEVLTTEAVGEENPTTTSGEGPVEVAPSEMTRRGGPFGAY